MRRLPDGARQCPAPKASATAAQMASTANEIAAMMKTGGEGAWIADPRDAAIAIFSSIPGIALASPFGLTVIIPCFR